MSAPSTNANDTAKSLALTPPHLVQKNHKASYPSLSPLRPELNQSGRTVLIAGGSAGIGFAIARAYADASASNVILTGRRNDVLHQAASQLSETYPKTKFVPRVCDVGNVEDSATLWSDLSTDGIFVDVLILNAAKFGNQQTLLEADLNVTWSLYDTNVRALLDFSQRLYKQEDSQGRKRFIVYVSTAAIHSRSIAAALPTYSLSKVSGHLLMQKIADEVDRDKVQIVSFHPGQILSETARSAGLDDNSYPFDDAPVPSQGGEKFGIPLPVLIGSRVGQRPAVICHNEAAGLLRCQLRKVSANSATSHRPPQGGLRFRVHHIHYVSARLVLVDHLQVIDQHGYEIFTRLLVMATQWDPLKDIPDLHGKVAVVTGGSTGIGFETVKLLARRGAKVNLTSRSDSKAQQTKETLKTKYPDIDPKRVKWLSFDMTDLKSIDAAAEELKSKESKVDILINNAAASTSSTQLVAGKWEFHMAANHIGPFLFINRVLPLLKNAAKAKDADVRIINLGSIAHISMIPRNFEFQFDGSACLSNPVPSYPWQWRYLGRFMFAFDIIRYAVSKAAVVLFTKELQNRLDEHGFPILVVVVHPGEVFTEGVLLSNNAFIKTIARFSFMTAEQGAATPLFAATLSNVRRDFHEYKAKFLVPVGKIENPNPVAENDLQVKGLWDITTVEVNEQLSIEGLAPLDTWVITIVRGRISTL
ncbi:hypothetical protein G7Z17_g2332 [Cylindrodendrum hubeiense]|uniref:Uncharacterized protein n=1 Tax=Cylindrodendrum hubeiense TaxID=595255 RepID=A0A9P5LBS4_9HYPO|nr:hypothetical protein G7Z17_g2332 [Cylindrodendrum hubeiense]